MDLSTFGEAVRAERIRQGLTQEQLARAAKISLRTLLRLEPGGKRTTTKRPNARIVQRLAKRLGLKEYLAADRGRVAA